MRLYLPLFLLLSIETFGQVNAGEDVFVSPGVEITLNADFDHVGNDVFISDDEVQGPFDIGFQFVFFGQVYDEFYIGANGFISFTPGLASGTREPPEIPTTDPLAPKNCILGPFQDWNPEIEPAPYIFYKTVGSAPERKLVVLWCDISLFSDPASTCLNSKGTFQIILNEGSNVIENHLVTKPVCSANKLATQGLHNENGTIGIAVPGRNAAEWSAEGESWHFIPESNNNYQVEEVDFAPFDLAPGSKLSWEWYKGVVSGSPEIRSSRLVIIPENSSVYYAIASTCAGKTYQDTVEVIVLPVPNAFRPGSALAENRSFSLKGLPVENISSFSLLIYNRWGQLVFESSDINEEWDGTYEGSECPQGAYFWVVYYKNAEEDKISRKGQVLLIR